MSLNALICVMLSSHKPHPGLRVSGCAAGYRSERIEI